MMHSFEVLQDACDYIRDKELEHRAKKFEEEKKKKREMELKKNLEMKLKMKDLELIKKERTRYKFTRNNQHKKPVASIDNMWDVLSMVNVHNSWPKSHISEEGLSRYGYYYSITLRKLENNTKVENILYYNPRKSQYSTKERRINSFSEYTNQCPKRALLKPQDLAEAGFFYSGKYFLLAL